MCFSPEVDLAVAVGLVPVAVASLREVRCPREVPFAALPLLFACHQLTEALVWREAAGHVTPAMQQAAALGYVLYAVSVLPVLVPAAVLLLEPRVRRRRRMAFFVALGAVVAANLTREALAGSVTVREEPRALVYDIGLVHGTWWAVLYVVAVIGPSLLSGHPSIVAFGLLNLGGLTAVDLAYREAFVSLWCLWAALTSVLILAHMVLRRRLPGSHGRAVARSSPPERGTALSPRTRGAHLRVGSARRTRSACLDVWSSQRHALNLGQELFVVSQAPESPSRGHGRARTDELIAQLDGADPSQRRDLEDELIALNVVVARDIARRYHGRGIPTEDLDQVACMGLVKAVRGFDASRAHDFLGYAVPTIRGEVRRHFRDQGWTVRPPRPLQELQPRVTRARGELWQRLGRDPRPEEIAEELEVELARVREAMGAEGCFQPASLDAAPDDGAAPVDRLGSTDGGYAQVDAWVTMRPYVRELDARERLILGLRFVEGRTQSEIGEQVGVTQMQVSRLLSGIFERLRHQLTEVA